MTDFEIHTFDEIPIGYTKNFSVKIDEEMLDIILFKIDWNVHTR